MLSVGQIKKEIIEKNTNKNFQIIQSLLNDDKRKVEELPMEEFLAVLSFKTAQFNALAFERKLQLKGCKKIPPIEERGDFKFPMLEKEIELKMSFPNAGNKLNLRQIRPWQNCDYIVTFCDYNNKNHKTYFLTHGQMLKEISERGCATHGTSGANAQNNKIEYSITLDLKEHSWDCFENKELNDFLYKE